MNGERILKFQYSKFSIFFQYSKYSQYINFNIPAFSIHYGEKCNNLTTCKTCFYRNTEAAAIYDFYLLWTFKSLYTIIPNDEGLRAFKQFFDRRTTLEPATATLLRLAELVLTLNCFSFDGHYFKQINGVAMGTKMGPSYANLFVGFIEEFIFEQYSSPKPEFFGRYIDNCVYHCFATSCSKPDLESFISYVISFHPSFDFTWEISETSVTFLDISVSITDNYLSTNVHYKPIDSHSYLLYSSSHFKHTLNSIPFSQFFYVFAVMKMMF